MILPIAINDIDTNLDMNLLHPAQHIVSEKSETFSSLYPNVISINRAFITVSLDSNNSKSKILKTIDAIGELTDDWDKRNANSVENACIENTRNLITSLDMYMPLPEIYPNPNGTITLDWETGDKLLSIEIGNTRYSAYLENGDDEKYDMGVFEKKVPDFLFISLQSLFKNTTDYKKNNDIITRIC